MTAREVMREAVEGVRDAVQLDVSGVNACVTTRLGQVWCWGTRQAAVMGDGVRVYDDQRPDFLQPTPVRIPTIDDAVEVAVGATVACALRQDQSVWCWGWNGYGGLPWPLETATGPVRVIEGP